MWSKYPIPVYKGKDGLVKSTQDTPVVVNNDVMEGRRSDIVAVLFVLLERIGGIAVES